MLGLFYSRRRAQAEHAAESGRDGPSSSMPCGGKDLLPVELVLAIESAFVYWRASREDDEDAAPIIHIATLGNWSYRDREEAVRRIERNYPELPRKHCIRAAKLIEAQIGRRNRLPSKRRRYISPLDLEEKLFWEGHSDVF